MANEIKRSQPAQGLKTNPVVAVHKLCIIDKGGCDSLFMISILDLGSSLVDYIRAYLS